MKANSLRQMIDRATEAVTAFEQGSARARLHGDRAHEAWADRQAAYWRWKAGQLAAVKKGLREKMPTRYEWEQTAANGIRQPSFF